MYNKNLAVNQRRVSQSHLPRVRQYSAHCTASAKVDELDKATVFTGIPWKYDMPDVGTIMLKDEDAENQAFPSLHLVLALRYRLND